MAATVTLHVWTGADANTDGGIYESFSFLTADSAASAAADRISSPITIPSSGSAYSYEKWISACIGVAPANSVGNFKVWGSAPAQTYPTGTCWLYGAVACTGGSAPVVTVSPNATADIGTATSGAKGTWDAASYAATGCQTAYLVMQLMVVSTAAVGNWVSGAAGCVLNYSYDEV